MLKEILLKNKICVKKKWKFIMAFIIISSTYVFKMYTSVMAYCGSIKYVYPWNLININLLGDLHFVQL